MRLENYGAARFDGGEAVIDEPIAEAPAAPAAEPAPEAPSRLLSELARQPNAFTPPPAPTTQTAPAAANEAPGWQGMSLPSAAPSPAGNAPGPGIDAATFARIEAMGSRDSAGGSRGGGFGGFGFGGFGGGNETETVDYTFSGVDGAPDVNVSVTYQGETPIGSTTTTTLGDSGSGVSLIPQEVICLPAVDSSPALAADLPSLPQPGNDSQAAAAVPGGAITQTSDGAASTAAGSAGTPAASATSGEASGTASDSRSTAATSSGDTPSGQASIYPDRYRVVSGLQGNEPAGGRDGLTLARDLPQLPSEFTPTTLDGRPGTGVPYRDREGQVYYRTFDADGAEVGLVGEPVLVKQLEPVVITGSRDPGGVFDNNDTPSQGPSPAGLSTLPIAARLAPVAGAVLEAEVAVGPPQLKAAALGSLAAAGAIAAWRASHDGSEREMLTPEEQAQANKPLINVPGPLQTASPPLLLPVPDDPADSILPGQPVDRPQGPTIEVLPAHQQNWHDLIITSNALNDGDRYGNIPGEDRWRYDKYLNETTNPNPLGPDAWYDKAQTAWQNNSAGNEFELAVRTKLDAPLGVGSKPVNIDGYVPDLPVGPRFGVTDVKNWVNLTNSDQLQSFYEYAKNNDMPFNVIVSPRTESISAPLLDNIRATGGSVIQFDPTNNQFTAIDIGGSGPWIRGKP